MRRYVIPLVVFALCFTGEARLATALAGDSANVSTNLQSPTTGQLLAPQESVSSGSVAPASDRSCCESTQDCSTTDCDSGDDADSPSSTYFGALLDIIDVINAYFAGLADEPDPIGP